MSRKIEQLSDICRQREHSETRNFVDDFNGTTDPKDIKDKNFLIENLKEELSQKCIENQDLTCKLKEATQDAEIYHTQVDATIRQVYESQRGIQNELVTSNVYLEKQLDLAYLEMGELESKIVKFEIENRHLEKQLGEVRDELSQQKQLNADLSKTITDQYLEIVELTKLNSSVSIRIESLQKNLSDSESQVEHMKRDIFELEHDAKMAEKNADELRGLLHALAMELEEAKYAEVKLKDLQCEYQEVLRILDTAEVSIKTEKRSIEEKLKTLETENIELKSRLESAPTKVRVKRAVRIICYDLRKRQKILHQNKLR